MTFQLWSELNALTCNARRTRRESMSTAAGAEFVKQKTLQVQRLSVTDKTDGSCDSKQSVHSLYQSVKEETSDWTVSRTFI